MTTSLAPLLWSLMGLLFVCAISIFAASTHRVVWTNPARGKPPHRRPARRSHPERKLYLVPPRSEREATV